MVLIKDPSSLMYLIETPAGNIVVPQDVRVAYNDLFRAWSEMTQQWGPVMRRRLNRATYFRARFDDQVKL
jgi:hypothetical protein